jgi:hypothetical protein
LLNIMACGSLVLALLVTTVAGVPRGHPVCHRAAARVHVQCGMRTWQQLSSSMTMGCVYPAMCWSPDFMRFKWYFDVILCCLLAERESLLQQISTLPWLRPSQPMQITWILNYWWRAGQGLVPSDEPLGAGSTPASVMADAYASFAKQWNGAKAWQRALKAKPETACVGISKDSLCSSLVAEGGEWYRPRRFGHAWHGYACARFAVKRARQHGWWAVS